MSSKLTERKVVPFIKPINELKVISNTGVFGKREMPLEGCLLYIKPYSNTPEVLDIINNILARNNIRIARQGKLSPNEMVSNDIISKQYRRVKNYAISTQSIPMNNEEKLNFSNFFDQDWDKAVDDGIVFNSIDACSYFKISNGDLYKKWEKIKVVKLSKGIYIGKFVHKPKKEQLKMINLKKAQPEFNDGPSVYSRAYRDNVAIPHVHIYVINGFFNTLQNNYHTTGAEYLSLEWNSKDISWEDFNIKVIGNVDKPAMLSIRGQIYSKWLDCKLKSEPKWHNNIIHVSASAFEGMVERLMWIRGSLVFTDLFGCRLTKAKIPSGNIRDWVKNPVVGGYPVFSYFHNMGSSDCIAIMQKLSSQNFDSIENNIKTFIAPKLIASNQLTNASPIGTNSRAISPIVQSLSPSKIPSKQPKSPYLQNASPSPSKKSPAKNIENSIINEYNNYRDDKTISKDAIKLPVKQLQPVYKKPPEKSKTQELTLKLQEQTQKNEEKSRKHEERALKMQQKIIKRDENNKNETRIRKSNVLTRPISNNNVFFLAKKDKIVKKTAINIINKVSSEQPKFDYTENINIGFKAPKKIKFPVKIDKKVHHTNQKSNKDDGMFTWDDTDDDSL
jgi:hypothetical protein